MYLTSKKPFRVTSLFSDISLIKKKSCVSSVVTTTLRTVLPSLLHKFFLYFCCINLVAAFYIESYYPVLIFSTLVVSRKHTITKEKIKDLK